MSLTPFSISIISSAIAVLALIISFVALYKTHFSKFNKIISVGDISHRVYPIRGGENKWYIPSFDLPLTITNSGARTGMVTGLRLRLHYSELPIPGNYELIYPTFEIEPGKSRLITKNRFNWIDELVIGGWMPFPVLPKATVTRHFVFESRWDDPVIQDSVKCDLELQINNKKAWDTICNWKVHLSPVNWSALTCSGRAFSYCIDNQMILRGEVHPSDLHKYTGSKESIPEDKFVHESYLDFPENDSEND